MAYLRLLIEPGGEVNGTRDGSTSPIFAASENGHAECVALLIECGADVSVARSDGVTGLGVNGSSCVESFRRIHPHTEPLLDQLGSHRKLQTNGKWKFFFYYFITFSILFLALNLYLLLDEFSPFTFYLFPQVQHICFSIVGNV